MENKEIQQYNVRRNSKDSAWNRIRFHVFLHTALRMLLYGGITKSRAQDAYEKLIIKDGKTMKTFQPKLFKVMKNYSKEQLIKDVVAGIIVAVIALPLSIALALASGVSPENGLYTAIVAGFIISFLGGSRVQIAGPTAAFCTIIAGIVYRSGMEGLIVATVLAGGILILMGVLRFGSLIRFIPYTITTGFTAGIAVTIAIGQLKDFLGLTFHESPVETMEKLIEVGKTITTFNWQAFVVAVVSLAILILWPKKLAKIPASLIAVLVGAAMVKLLDMNVNTIGSLYEINGGLPKFSVPNFSMGLVKEVLPDAFTIAVLAAVESLLSCVVADGMINSRHNSNTELIAQGAGNIVSGLFGGIPATGAIARTAANIKNGGRTPIAGMVHAVTLALVMVVLMPYAALIPMPTIAAILMMVAYNMCGWRQFVAIIKTSPKSDILVLVLTFGLTVVFDLVVAIEVGLVLAALLFMKRMSDVAHVHAWKDAHDPALENQADIILKEIPKHTLVYEIDGPMFFGAAEKFMNFPMAKDAQVLILRMRNVPAMDVSGLRAIESVQQQCAKHNVTLILSHVCEQPLAVIKKAELDKAIGEENFCANIDAALARAAMLTE